MRTIELNTLVKAPRELVWNILTNFNEYPHWEPLVHLTGPSEIGADLECHIRINKEIRRVPGRAVVTECEPNSRFAWAVKVDPFLKVEERYSLLTDRCGTHLVHHLCLSGWISVPWYFFLKRMMRATLSTTDQSLVMRIDHLTNNKNMDAPKTKHRGKSGRKRTNTRTNKK